MGKIYSRAFVINPPLKLRMTTKQSKRVVEDRKDKRQQPKRRRIKLSKYAPILKWLPKYSKYQAVSDAIAGITIGLTMIPQSIAYATLAGLSAQYGLYSSFVGGFLYAILGSVREISIGPTSLMALLTIEFTKGLNVDFVILLTFLTGVIEFLMGSFNLGFLVDFISLPVTSGFTSATSVIIIVSQLKGLFGLKLQSENLMDLMIKIAKNLKHLKIYDTTLGLSSIFILLCLRKLKDVKVRNPVLGRLLWFLSVGRNALVVLICSTISFCLHDPTKPPLFTLSGQVRSGLPNVSFPKFSTVHNNRTYGFIEMSSSLGSGIVILPLVSVLANVAIAKVFASGAALQASHEMRTLGICNLAGSCVSSMPTCGAFTRSAVSSASGIQTPFAGIYSGILTILALSFLTPYFFYIPKATLSAVLISAVVFLVDLEIVHRLWKGSKRDGVATVGTFFVCIIFNVEAGLMLGIFSNVVYLLYLSARPTIEVIECTANLEHRYLLVQPDVGLFFPAVDYVANKISDIADDRAPDSLPIVVDCQRFRGVDYTAVKGLEKLSKDFEERGLILWFLNLNHKVVRSVKKLGDLKSLKILKDETEILTQLFGLESSIKLQIVSDNRARDIPMETLVPKLPEAESLLAKDKKNNSEAKNPVG